MSDPYASNGNAPQQPQQQQQQVNPNHPLKDIPQPHPHDVLCGRGGGTNSHIGNTQWRALVQDNKKMYLTLPKKQKMLLSQSIVMSIRSQNPPGRFLIKDAKTDLWYDVGDQRATEKTSQALREGAPTLRENLSAAPTSSSGGEDNAPSRPSDASSSTTSSRASNQAAPQQNPAVGLEYLSGIPVGSMLGTMSAAEPVLPPVIPPPVPPQGPVAARRPRVPKQPPSSQDDAVPPLAPESLDPLPLEDSTAAAPLPLTSHEEYVEPPAPLEPDQVFSFGSIHVSDAEHARLLHNYSLGSAQEPSGAYIADAGGEPAAASRRAVQFGDPVLQQYREHHADYEDYEDVRNIRYGSHAPVPSTVPLPVDGGLEPAGLSMGSVMSYGTTMSDIDPDLLTRLEPTGVSFGSLMSFVRELPDEAGPQGDYRRAHPSSAAAPAPPVDYGLEAIGTSFGSMSLAVDSIAPMPTNEAANPARFEAQPTFLQQAVSRGNLLECSDTDDEEESSHRQHSLVGGASGAGGSGSGSGGGLPGGPSQSAGYEQLRAALEAQNYVDLTASTSAIYSTGSSNLMPPPPPLPNGSTPGSYPPPPPPQHQYAVRNDAYVNEGGDRPYEIPTPAFDRDFSQMSALSVDDHDDYRHNNGNEFQPVLPLPNGQPSQHQLPPQQQYLHDNQEPYAGGDDAAAMPPPPMMRQSSDHWESHLF
jgi:hypothetical protein